MKILVVGSGNKKELSPFILDQIDALSKLNLDIDVFRIKGKGMLGYIKNFKPLISKIETFNPDIIHAHFGLSGLLCGLQRRVPVITTLHGSDINNKKVRMYSILATYLSKMNIVVSKELGEYLTTSKKVVIPCGVDFSLFYPRDRKKMKMELGLDLDKKYILFSSSFSNKVKNYPLAQEAVLKLNDSNIVLLELKGFNRSQVAKLMNAVDLVLMTSFSEGSPQFIKEAMSCNIPIVTTDVGDVRMIIGNTINCFVVPFNAEDISDKMIEILNDDRRTNGREKIKQLDNNMIASQIFDLYESLESQK